MDGALQGEIAASVPCGSCTACCTSAQFVHIEPDEGETIARIPRRLLFAAPGRPRGHLVLGYDERGHCPMLAEGRCSIYEHRPRTCRTYDCRVFPAAGISADEDKVEIARQARRWAFTFASADDALRHQAVRAAAVFLRTHRALLPDAIVPVNATQLAVLAFRVHDAFLERDEQMRMHLVEPPMAAVVRRLASRRNSDLGRTRGNPPPSPRAARRASTRRATKPRE